MFYSCISRVPCSTHASPVFCVLHMHLPCCVLLMHFQCSVFYSCISRVLCFTHASPVFCVLLMHLPCSVFYSCISRVLCFTHTSPSLSNNVTCKPSPCSAFSIIGVYILGTSIRFEGGFSNVDLLFVWGSVGFYNTGRYLRLRSFAFLCFRSRFTPVILVVKKSSVL